MKRGAAQSPDHYHDNDGRDQTPKQTQPELPAEGAAARQTVSREGAPFELGHQPGSEYGHGEGGSAVDEEVARVPARAGLVMKNVRHKPIEPQAKRDEDPKVDSEAPARAKAVGADEDGFHVRKRILELIDGL